MASSSGAHFRDWGVEMVESDETNEICDFCEERRKIKFANLTRGFCSVECVNAYLKHEGFQHRLCINCEKNNVHSGNVVCDECLNPQK